MITKQEAIRAALSLPCDATRYKLLDYLCGKSEPSPELPNPVTPWSVLKKWLLEISDTITVDFYGTAITMNDTQVRAVRNSPLLPGSRLHPGGNSTLPSLSQIRRYDALVDIFKNIESTIYNPHSDIIANHRTNTVALIRVVNINGYRFLKNDIPVKFPDVTYFYHDTHHCAFKVDNRIEIYIKSPKVN